MTKLTEQRKRRTLISMRKLGRKFTFRVYYLAHKFSSNNTAFISVAANDKREALAKAKEFARTCLFTRKEEFDRVIWGKIEKVMTDEKYKDK